MKNESVEKKVIEALQQYSSPEPDPAFEARLKEKFLQKASAAKRKQKFFRTLTWSGAVAAVVFVGLIGYYGNPLSWNDNQAGDPKQSLVDPGKAEKQMDKWQTMDISQLENIDSDPEGKHNLGLFRSMDKKKLYAVRDNKALLLYESQDTEVVNARIYPFPTQPNQFYIWFTDKQVLVKDKKVKSVNHLTLLQSDGTFLEIKELPQPGYNTNLQIEWSPSGNKAYLAMANGEEWVVGELIAEQSLFIPLYGQITKENTDVNYVPGEALKWKAAWVNDTQLIVYNPGSHAFYGVNLETQSAWEIDALVPEFPKGHYVKNIVVPQGTKSPVAIVQVGKVMHDASFSGEERIYTLNMETNELNQVDHMAFQSKFPGYDQYYLSPNREGSQQIMGTVATTDRRQFNLRLGLYNVETQEFESSFERSLPESLYINHEVKVSPNEKLAVFRIHAYPIEGGAKEYLIVLDLETGKEVIEPMVKDFFSSYEFESDSSLKVDDQSIPLR